MHGKYKLVGHNAVEVEDLLEWAKSMESDNRICNMGRSRDGTQTNVYRYSINDYGGRNECSRIFPN